MSYLILSFNLPGITCLQVLSPIFLWIFVCSLWGTDTFPLYVGLKHPSKCCLCFERSAKHEESHYPVLFQLPITPSLSVPNVGPFSHSQHGLKLQPTCYQFCICGRDISQKRFSYFAIFVTDFFNSVAGSTTFGRHQVQFHLFQDPNERTQWSSYVQQWSQLLTCKLLLSRVSWNSGSLGDDFKRLTSSGSSVMCPRAVF
jgi:hypothetical protein